MRLRLTVRRHGLPDANILWSSDGLHAIPQGNNDKSTIAQFLLQVNEVIPLESEDWGLEDYVVEVGGFECVHFSTLESVLEKDDQIVIRPLELDDRRFRRVSGRVQIAADGRRLYDGVAFGRLFIRRAQRPPVRIPSIKRARVAYDDEEDEEEGLVTSNQLVLRDDSEDEDDDLDYNNELSPREIADLAADSVRSEHMGRQFLQSDIRYNPRKRRRTGLGLENVRVSSSLTPENYSSGSRPQRRQEYGVGRIGIRESPRNVRFDTDDLETPATILDMDTTDDDDDEDFDSEADETEGSEANKENIAPTRSLRSTAIYEASGTSNDSESEPISTSDSDSGDSEDETEISSSSSSSSTSSSESSDDTSSSGESILDPTTNVQFSPNTKKTSSSRLGSAVEIQRRGRAANGAQQTTNPQVNSSPQQVLPGQGKNTTKKRNARRKIKKRFDRAKILEAQKSILHESRLNPMDHIDDMLGETAEAGNNLERQKAMLLQNLNPTGNNQVEGCQGLTPAKEVETTVEANTDQTMASIQENIPSSSPGPELLSTKEQTAKPQNTVPNEGGLNSAIEQSSTQLSHQTSASKQVNSESTKITPRRSKLDLGSAQRMLFGSLGLRAPRTKDDQNKLRDQLEAKAQKLPGNMIGPVQPTKQDSVPAAIEFDETDESWRDSIDLQAVECCYDGVKYSAPPFPFVQRWDPQQQYSTKQKVGGRGGRGKRQRRNNQKYYQDYDEEAYQDYDNSYLDDSYQEQINISEERARDVRSHTLQANQDALAANEQLLEETHKQPIAASDDFDFPPLPVDMSTLPVLTSDTARNGNIIAFKQMEVSEQTGWCPAISEYKTARVETILDNDLLGVLLAERDFSQREKIYDPQTGERLYSKFEMPGEGEDEDEVDNGYREITIQEMIDARLVKDVEIHNGKLGLSTTIQKAIDGVKDILVTGRDLVGAAFPAVESTERTDASPIEKNVLPHSDKVTPQDKEGNPVEQLSMKSAVSYVGSKETSRPQRSLSDYKQEAMNLMGSPGTTLREASVELGSEDPPRRFFSELRSSQVSVEINEPENKVLDDEDGSMRVAQDNSSVVVSHDGAADDPSLWHPGSQVINEAEPTQYYSPLPGDADQRPVTSSHDPPFSDAARPVDDEIDNVTDIPNKAHENTGATSAQDDSEDIAAQPIDEDEMDGTFTQDSVNRESELNGKKLTTAISYNWKSDMDRDSDSSSLPSLKDLLSQPIPGSTKTSKVKRKYGRRNNVAKVPSTAPEIIDSHAILKAPKRMISDTHKIAVGTDIDSHAGTDDNESPAELYELEAHLDSTTHVRSEDNDPELPELPVLEPSSMLKASNTEDIFFIPPPPASQLSTSAKGNSMVDLTLSSDQEEFEEETTPKRKRPARRVASGMPSGPGWVDKGSSKGSKGKSPKRNLKRTRSTV